MILGNPDSRQDYTEAPENHPFLWKPNSFDSKNLFWPQKLHFKVKIDNFHIYMLITDTQILYFPPIKIWKNPPSKVGYFSKISACCHKKEFWGLSGAALKFPWLSSSLIHKGLILVLYVLSNSSNQNQMKM